VARLFPSARFARRRVVGAAAVLVVLVLLAPQAWAWYHLRAAKSALAKYRPAEARASLASCARVWDGRASVRLLAARAAWQDGDTPTAAAELRAAQRLLGGADDDTAFEWALIRAADGHVPEVEQFLQQRAEQSPAEAGPLVWEALAAGYLRVYRILDAMACLNHWLKRDPDNVRALELRGRTYVAGRGVVRGAEDFRRVLELDPTRRATRGRLAEAALSLGGYEEAARHLEVLGRENPDDPEIAARLARCYALLQRGDEARRLIDAALAKHPDDGPCLRTRGHLAILNQRPADAEADLRAAVARMPGDYQAHQLLFQSLQQQGKEGEARAQLKVAEAVRDRSEQLGELSSRAIAQSPLDPALYVQLGKLTLGSGGGDAGRRWLLYALQLDPEFRPAHAALAAYYDSVGDKARAEEHRRKAAP
jgi:predicted Zn-dependent protease